MKNCMSSRERMLAALTCQGPDRVPFSPYICQGPWMGEPFSWQDQLERADRLLEMGLDPTIDIWFPYPQPHRDVRMKSWRDTSGPEPLLTMEYHTPAGVLRQVVRETDDWCSALHTQWVPTTFGSEKRSHFNMELLDDWNVPRRVEPWVKGPEDLEALRYLMQVPEGHALDEWRMDTERALEFAGKHDLLTVARRTIVGDAFQWFCNIEQFMIWMIEEPQFVQELLGIWQEWSLSVTKLALEAGVDIVQRRGWYESPTYWGVKYFKEYLAPLIEEETKLVHDAGKLHCYLNPEGSGAHSDVLKDLNVDIIMGVDPRMLHGGDMKMLFRKLGENKSFWGGVNAEVVMETGNPEVIDKAVRQAVEDLGGNGGLVLGAFLFQRVPPGSIIMMIDAWKKCC